MLLFPPKAKLGKATKALVRTSMRLTYGFTSQTTIRGFYFKDRSQLDTILKMFIPSESFWNKLYHKYESVGFSWPNVNENMWIEFGKIDNRGNWVPSIPNDATHVGLYFWDYGFRHLVDTNGVLMNIERKIGKRYYYFVVKKLPFKVDAVDVEGHRYYGDDE